jgi:hypothetical protein
MAESAGIVNEQGRSHDDAFRRVIESSSPTVSRLAWATRDLVYDVFPATIEVVWPTQGSVGWGVGPRKFSEQFAYFMPFKKHVRLGFYHGGGLEDPTGLLRAGGTQASGRLSMRSLKITSLDEVTRSELRDLLLASTQHGVPPPRG